MSALETIITKGAKVAEQDVLKVIEQLMNQLLKLDGIMGEGDVKLQRKMQVCHCYRPMVIFVLFLNYGYQFEECLWMVCRLKEFRNMLKLWMY